jgi:hypothetical protein
VASLAWFDKDAIWCATLVDPDDEHPPLDATPDQLLRAYYSPIVEAGLASSDWIDGPGFFSFTVPEHDIRVVLPAAIVSAIQDPGAGPGSMVAAVKAAAELELGYEPDDDEYLGPDSVLTIVVAGEAPPLRPLYWH